MDRTNSHNSQYASSLIEASLDPLITISIDGKIMDLNQDGKLEVILTAHFWEGFGAQIYEINGTKPAEVLKYKCGE